MIDKKKCKLCKEPLPFTERGGLKTYKHKGGYGIDCGCFYSDDEGAKKAFQKFVNQNKIKFRKEVKKKEKEQKESLTDYKPKLQSKINEIARLIDIGLPCLALGYHAGQIHAGHIYSRGSNQTIRYNLHNIHRQSAQSNHSHNDDGLLREKLGLEYGLEYLDFVSNLRSTPSLELHQYQYKELYKKASKIALKLKREGNVYASKEQRIEMRNKINLELDIYGKEYCEFKIKNLLPVKK